jgi:hypothetical protein
MQRYRVILFDANGRFLNHEYIDGRDDDDAIDRIGRRDHPFGMELRDGARVIARFDAIGARRSWRLGR